MRWRESNRIPDVGYVKVVMVGSINPSQPFSEDTLQQQVDLLNRCLNDYPKGCIIGKDVSIGKYMVGEHELTMERTAYHIGFARKPMWLDEKKGKEEEKTK